MCAWRIPKSPKLKTGEIHLWRADLDRNRSRIPVFEQMLTQEERQKASRFKLEVDRNRYTVARVALRTLLARYLRAAPGELRFCYGPQGKPELAGADLGFSVSHSERIALYAISQARDVGVDVERVRSGIARDVAKGFFSLRVTQLLESLPQAARRRAFFRGWTRMEAYLKARGDGLSLGLETFEAFLSLGEPASSHMPDAWASSWRLHDFCPRAGYVAALAAQISNWQLKFWQWQAEYAEDAGAKFQPFSASAGSQPGAR